ncbi:MAG: helix-turn-helix domain-containing protein [Solirubrobacterales bacterium]
MRSTAEPPHRALGDAIKLLRAELGLTQEDLSERSGLHITEISRLESGRRNPKLATLDQVAAGLEVPCWCLVALRDGLSWDEVSRLRQMADSS